MSLRQVIVVTFSMLLAPGRIGLATHGPLSGPPAKHVFLIMLENESYDRAFGPRSKAPYLARTLPTQGALLRQYYAIGHESLPNYVALVSGQAPNEATQKDCETYREFRLARPALDVHGQAIGTGCVYPPAVRTLVDQLESEQFTWRGYMQDLGNDPRRERAACGHPAIGRKDPTTHVEAKDQYATKWTIRFTTSIRSSTIARGVPPTS